MRASPRWRVVAHDGERVVVVDLDEAGAETARRWCSPMEWREAVTASDAAVRWVWSDTARWYPELLDAGVTVARCHDLRLCRAIVRSSELVTAPELRSPSDWDAPAVDGTSVRDPGLFDLDDLGDRMRGVPDDIAAVLAEFARQQVAVAAASDPSRLRLLLAAESAGGLLAAELHAAGLPWSRAVHEAILTETLGARPAAGAVPERVRELGADVRTALGDPTASLDSQPKLLRSLHRVGVLARSTSRWELADYDHPAIAPLLQYKKLTRLASANGWAWLDEWAGDGRFRPVYVPGGVVTGRWASSGGGALQLPRQLRPAVHADPGWVLVVADVAQLEPRVLAAISGDVSLADAARGRDLYDGLVAAGTVPSRAEAKIAMLGAMYGATTGDSGRLVPALRRAYPRAMGLVDAAARTGEEGGVVSTWLGRSAPPPPAEWHAVQDRAGAPDASETDRDRARRSARDRGRFTRNFVVQGTAAEWALAWLADLRGSLAEIAPQAGTPAEASGPVFSRRPHLCFFLHDEIIVHSPAELADQVAAMVRESAARAAHLLFGGFPIDFPLDLRIAQDAAKT
ncbi:bifunctional 3'-5' exonuclease/DNA polymerase [Microbacterium dextranolyticum]|nr:bifunctional 3'-5' exonuclease/DNA polymerase [Microbacterium dextranolyticum]MBM7462961.1 DNA polymerase-1 [Microbacterium dextranolyticum]